MSFMIFVNSGTINASMIESIRNGREKSVALPSTPERTSRITPSDLLI